MSRVPAVALTLLLAGEARAGEHLGDKSLEELMDVDVEAPTRAPQSAREVPSIVTVITREDLRTWGFQSVAEALVLVPGIYCIDDQVSPDCGVRGITAGARGGSRIVKVMIDGQPISMRSDSSAALGPELVPIELVERIEVVRGPVSALYGANAFFGTINVVTRRDNLPIWSAHLRLNDHAGYGVGLLVSGRSGPLSVLVGLSVLDDDYDGLRLPRSSPDYEELELAGNLEADDTRVAPAVYFARLGLDLGELELEAAGRYAQLDASAEFSDFSRLTHENRISLFTADARLAARWKPDARYSLFASLSGATGGPSADEQLSTGALDSWPKREFGYRALDAVVEGRLAFRDEDSLTIGLDGSLDDEDLIEIYRVDRVTGEVTLTSDEAGRRTFENGGAYAQAIVHPLPELGLTGNVRHDRHNHYGSGTTFRLGAVWAPSRLIAAKLLYGTSYKAPPIIQIYSQPLFPGEVIGNDDLEPERAALVEGSVTMQPLADLAFNLVGFASRVRDKVELVPVAANLQPTNIARQEGWGLEAEVWWRPGRHAFFASLAYQDTDTVTDNVFVGETSSPSERYPGLAEQLRWTWRHPSYGRPGLAVRYASQRRGSVVNIRENLQTPYAIDRYLTVDAVYTFTRGPHALQLRVDNLFDADTSEPGFGGVDLPGRGRQAWLIYTYAAEVGP